MRLIRALTLVLALPVVACDDEASTTPAQMITDGGADAFAADAGPGPDADLPDAMAPDAGPSASFAARAGVNRVAVWRAAPDTTFEVIDEADGEVVDTADTDALGSRVFRELPAGTYSVRPVADPDDAAGGLEVFEKAAPPPAAEFYSGQTMAPGFGYITMRDGTQLSVFVSLPGPPEDGPYPTLVNYSGYSPSQPGESLGAMAEPFCTLLPVLCDAPSFPTGIIGGVMGFATVGVNMRGTGCSGGAYDFFDDAQKLDGYDVIEIVAAQPWVRHHKVGMVGLSFPGISQLFVAAEQPPSLAAIAPMSVIADTVASTLAPGGIYNNGFALAWIENVLDRAAPYGHGWIRRKVEEDGDTLCEDNQLLHDQRLDVIAKALENPWYTDEVAAPVDPSAFVDRIQVPVFMSGQWQDEQTGPHFATLADKFVNAPVYRLHATNGVHIDGLAPQILREWYTFLSIYVAQEAPSLDPVVDSLVPVFIGEVFGGRMELPEDRYADLAGDLDAIRAAYEAEPMIRVIFESGTAEGVGPALPAGPYEARFAAWPPPETVARRWFFQPDGTLGDAAPEVQASASQFVHDPEAGQRGTLAGGSVNSYPINWAWPQMEPGKAVSFLSAPLEEDVVMVGSGSVDLFVRSTGDNADFEVLLSEVRPDDQESYVQAGWLRATHRALRDDATALRPVKTHRREDAQPLVPGEWAEARVELMPFAHVFRAGSRIRISVDTPGDSMASWLFLLGDYDPPPTNAIGHDALRPSSMLLPVIPGIEVPTPRPDCTALRGQPCHPFMPYENTPAEMP